MDWNLTWGNHRAYPEFTECFRSTVLQCLGSMWLLLSGPIYLYLLLRSHESDTRPRSWLYTTKQSLLVLQLSIRLLQMKSAIDATGTGENGGYWTARVTGLAAEGLTMVFSLVLLELERRKRFVTSGVQSIYWLMTSLSAGALVYSECIAEVDKVSFLDGNLLRAWLGLAVCQLALCFYTDCPPARIKEECPLARASFFSRCIFSWMDSFMKIGYSRPLEPRDFSCLPPGDQSDAVIANFEAAWNHQVKLRAQNDVSQHKKTDVTATTDISLIRVLVRTYGADMVGCNCLRLLSLLAELAQPALIGFLISLAEDSTIPTWKGYVYLAAFLICFFLECVTFNYVHHLSLSTAQRMKAALTNAIFNKSLRLTHRARSQSTTGEIANLVSTDVENLNVFTAHLWNVWTHPLYVVSCFVILYKVHLWTVWTLDPPASVVILYKNIGIGAFAGLAVLVLVLPFNLYLSRSGHALHQARMDKKDARIKLLTEILNGIKILKLYAWEMAFGEKIQQMRKDELAILKRKLHQGMIVSFSWCVAPFLMGLVSLATYVYYVSEDHMLSAQTAFSSLIVLGLLATHFHDVPYVFANCMKGAVAMGRVHMFLNKEELDTNDVTHTASADAISITNGTFTWDPTLGHVLKEINMMVPRGSLVAVVGRVGSGKSSLLSAILGEVEKTSGFINVDGDVAYVPQQAWIQNDTLQNNILFGKKLNANTYKSVIEACALVTDLDILPGKDQTELGEKGINLSGGQKQRVSMARAVYNDADIYLMDDPLSSVDVHVGKHIFDHVIGRDGLLRNKTRVLVTHGLTWLKDVDEIFVVDDGMIVESGSYQQLVLQKGDFARFVKEYTDDLPINEEGSDVYLKDAETAANETATTKEQQRFRRSISRSLSLELKQDTHLANGMAGVGNEENTNELQQKGQFVDEEEIEIGKVQMKYITPYIDAIGVAPCVLIFAFFACYKLTNVAEGLWLKEWTDNSDINNTNTMPGDINERQEANLYYIGIYAALGIFEGTMLLIHEALLSFSIVRGAAKLHELMLVNILRGKMSFFDSTPVGRIINRFSQDMEPLDGEIVDQSKRFLHVVFGLCSIFCVIMYSIPKFVVMALPVSLLYLHMRKYFLPARRQIKRLESKKRSPIFSHLSESLGGASVIRAFGCQTRFSRESAKKVDTFHEMRLHNACIDRWMCIRLDMLNLLCLFVTVCFSLSERDVISGATMGLLMNYALRLNLELFGLIRVSGELESSMVSLERIGQYSTKETEAALHTPTVLPEAWPDQGELQFMDYSLRYRPGTDLVLRGVNFSVRKGERVGIVGRTGAGKSSLAIGLFRLVESAEGSVHIDGYDITELGLFDLRSNLTILPQEPVLFSGTLKFNLDPMNVHSDEALYNALQLAHLKDFVTSLPDKLEYECGEGGQNLSVGQRQLICLARCLLRKSKVLVLDEATAAVDMETDELIQNTIKAEFRDCTVLTIAHRLNTILDYDRILVLAHGEVEEYDSPKTLLQDKTSMFFSMARDANLVA